MVELARRCGVAVARRRMAVVCSRPPELGSHTSAPMRTLLVLLTLGQLAAATFLNPVLPVAPDPAIVYGDGRYFATWTLGDRIVLRAAPTLAGLGAADEVVVLRSTGDGPAAIDWWAPELHRLDGRWWLYWCATTADRDDGRRRVFVSGCVGDDPLTGTW